MLQINKIRILVAFASCNILPVFSQSMVIESLSGPVTKNETDAFKAYLLKVNPPVGNDQNVWVYGNPGKSIEACGLMYETTRDVVILDRMIGYCDAALAGRNDLATRKNGGQRTVWTGQVEPVWPSSDSTVIPAGAGVEQGQILSHIAFCARLILETPSVWDTNISSGDPNGFGATYKARALKYISECDYVVDKWILPHFIRTSDNNHYYFPGPPNTYKANEPAPWNQAWMLTNGLVRLVQCHLILNDDASRVTSYDAIIRPNIDWFRASLTANRSKAGTPCWTWAYALPSGMEDTNHAAYDMEGLWIAYNTGRYGLQFDDMVPFANTYVDVVLATVTNGIFAGKVDGSTGTGNAGGDNYVRDEYLYMAEFRPEKFEYMANIEISTNKIASSLPITARTLWEKNRRYTGAVSTGIFPNTSSSSFPGLQCIPNPAVYFTDIIMGGTLLSSQYTLSVFNINGQKVKMLDLPHVDKNRIRLYTYDLPAGMYFLKLAKDNVVMTSRLFVVK